MRRTIALILVLVIGAGAAAGGDAKLKRQEAQFPEVRGKWQIVGAKGDAASKHITLEFFRKKAAGPAWPFLRVHLKWQEGGQDKQTEIVKACRFHKDGEQLSFTLTESPVSAEPGLWVKYKIANDKLELTEMPPVLIESRIGLSGVYQRVATGNK